MKLVWTVIAVTVGILLTAAPAVAQDAKAEKGMQVVAAQKCTTCHSIAGKGNKMFPLDGVGAKLSTTDLRRWLTHTAEMEAALAKKPAMKMSSKKYELKDADLDALVAYLESLKK